MVLCSRGFGSLKLLAGVIKLDMYMLYLCSGIVTHEQAILSMRCEDAAVNAQLNGCGSELVAFEASQRLPRFIRES